MGGMMDGKTSIQIIDVGLLVAIAIAVNRQHSFGE